MSRRYISILKVKHRDRYIYTTSKSKAIEVFGKRVESEAFNIRLTKKAVIDLLNREIKKAA